MDFGGRGIDELRDGVRPVSALFGNRDIRLSACGRHVYGAFLAVFILGLICLLVKLLRVQSFALLSA